MDKKILIVDDDFDTLHMVGKMLERHGFQILAANNGEKALNVAQSEIPDLILLDVMMPGMDGYEVTRQLRAMENTAFIPIILFTAKAQVDDKLEGFEAGADDYLTKPTHPAELIARVKTILTRPKTGALVMEEDTAPSIENANVIGVISTKGGLGVSTLALNLAISIHVQTNDYVTLAELHPGLGTIGLQLGYRKSDSLNNLLRKNALEILFRDVEDGLVTHGSGIQILLASFNPIDAELINAVDQIEAVVKHLPRIARHTILDLGAGLIGAAPKILPLCDQVVVVVEPIPSTIIQTKALLANLEDLGVDRDTIFPVLISRIRLEITVPNIKVQEQLGLQLAGIIMPAPELAYQAAARNEPILTFQPDSLTTRQYQKVAETLLKASPKVS